MRKWNGSATWLLLAVLLAAPLTAQDPQPATQAGEKEQEHVVRRGDTLWDLAGRYLGNPFQWPVIHRANTTVVADPHWIYPDQVLVVPGLRARVEPWTRPMGATSSQDGTAAQQASMEAAQPQRTLFYREPQVRSGDRPTVLVEPTAGRAPVSVGEFYRAEFLARPESLQVVGRVLRSTRELDPEERLPRTAQPRDDLYVAHTGRPPVAVGDRYLVAEMGRQVAEADHEARMIVPRAVVRVVEVEPEVMRVHLEEQFGRVMRDDVLLPLEFYPDFVEHEPVAVAAGSDLEGRILAFVDDNTLPGKMARAFIDLGRAQGVQAGDVFEAYLPPRRARSADDARRSAGELLPEESAAVLRVIRVTDLGATVVADEVMQPRLGAGLPVRRVARMP